MLWFLRATSHDHRDFKALWAAGSHCEMLDHVTSIFVPCSTTLQIHTHNNSNSIVVLLMRLVGLG